MKRIVKYVSAFLEYVAATIITLMVFLFVCYGTTPASGYAEGISDERNVQIQKTIIWKCKYSQRIENEIVYNLNKLPGAILESWLDTDSHIIVYPNKKGCLDQADGVSSRNGYTIAYNEITAKNNMIQHSDIHILGSVYIIDRSLLHEMGHYVYGKSFGMNGGYTLPNYDTECERFIENECGGEDYYALPEEYFAEMFAYTVVYGVNENYNDSYEMNAIINKFFMRKNDVSVQCSN